MQQAFEIDQSVVNRAGVARHLQNMGITYWYKGDYQAALHHLTVALEIAHELNDKAGVALHMSNLANVYDEMGEYDRALDYGEQAITLFRELGARYYLGGRLILSGETWRLTGNTTRAHALCEEGLRIAEEVERKEFIFLGQVL